MDLTTFLPVALLLALLAAGTPVAFALLTSGALGILLLDGAQVSLNTLARAPFSQLAAYTFIVIPMFVLMAIAARRARIAEAAFATLAWYLRKIPGGVALATIVACAGFAAVSGSSIATVAALGKMAISEMRRHGYSYTVAAGVVGAAGTLGVLIPPSIPLVIYGLLTRESIGMLLLAGLIPGLFSAFIYGGALLARARYQPEQFGRGHETMPLARPDLSRVVSMSLRIALLFLIVVGGIYSGILTAVESSALGALAAVALLMAAFWRRPRLAFTEIRDSLTETVRLNGMIFALLMGAGVFTTYSVAAGLPQAFTRWAVGLPLTPELTVLLLLLVFIPMGMFLDPLSLLVIGVPLAYPAVTALGFDGIWFGILVVKMIELGLITPPVGMNAFVVASTHESVTPEVAFRGLSWYVPLDLVTVLLIFFVPAIVTWLPQTIRG